MAHLGYLEALVARVFELKTGSFITKIFYISTLFALIMKILLY